MSNENIFDVSPNDDRLNISLITTIPPEDFNTSGIVDEPHTFFIDIYRTTAGTLVFLATVPFLLFHFRCFPARTTSAALFGATLMVALGVITPTEAYRSIGREDRLTAVFLLVGMTLVAEFAERERLVRRALRVLLSPEQSFVGYSFRVCALAFVLAMIVSADAACVLLIPVLVECFHEQERPKYVLISINIIG